MEEIEGIEDVEIVQPKIKGKKKDKDCKSCQNPGLKPSHWFMVALGFYMLFATIYGTIQLFRIIF